MKLYMLAIKLLLLGLLFILPAISLQAQTKVIEQLQNELKLHSQEDTFRVNRLNKLGFELRNKKPKESQALHSEALIISRKLNYDFGEASSLLSLSFYYRFSGEYMEAIRIGNESLEKFTQLKDTANIIAIIYNMAYITSGQGELTQSINYSFDALRLAERIKSSKWLILTKTLLGNIFNRINETTKAKEYLLDALKMAESVSDENGKEHCIMPLGNIAVQEKRFNEAIGYYEKGYGIAVQKKDIRNQVFYTLNIAGVNLSLKKFNQVFVYTDLANEIMKQNDFTGNASWLNNILANTYFETGKIDSAIFYGEKCLRGGEDRGQKNSTKTINKLLAAAYASKGNYAAAFSRQQAFMNFKDSLNETEAVRRIAASQYAYELEKKQAEIDLLAQNEKLVKERNNQQRKLLWGSWIGLILIAGLLSFLWRNNRQKQKANTILESTLSKLKSTQAQLIQSEKLASLGELTAGIAHEIQNPLIFVNNFSELSVDLVKDLKDELKRPEKDETYIDELFDDLSQNQEKINHHGKRASSIVKGMLEHSRASTGVKELIDMNKLADEYLRLSYHGLRAKDKDFNADFTTDFDENLPKINVIPQDIGRVLLNLINNAFYASLQKVKLDINSSYKPKVTVTTLQLDNQIIIKVLDNGTGMPESVRAKVFQPFFTTKPTGQGTGLGLSLAYDIVTKGHGGALKVESTEGVGTEFKIILPIQ